MKNLSAILLIFLFCIACATEGDKKNLEKNNEIKSIDFKPCCQAEKELKYRERFDYIPEEIPICFDINEAISLAANQKKPILMIFTGFGCKSQRDIDWVIFNNKKSIELIKEKFIVSLLIVDDMTNLQKPYFNDESKQINTIGECYYDFQVKKYNNNTQPYYCIVNDSLVDLVKPISYTSDTSVGFTFLNMGLMQFKK